VRINKRFAHQPNVRVERAALKSKDELGRMKAEGFYSPFILHPSSFILHPSSLLFAAPAQRFVVRIHISPTASNAMDRG
jgi:hypothetical protein